MRKILVISVEDCNKGGYNINININMFISEIVKNKSNCINRS